MKARVTVYPRSQVLDPQGKAISQALERVGFGEVRDVRAGKSFDIELDIDDPQRARERVESMCEALLANTVVEDYTVSLLEGESS
jgi:phosphoribosylformylglycinamidine synthase